MSDFTVSALDQCTFNWHKGLWETFPEHWVWFRTATTAWIFVAFWCATDLHRGVPS